VEVSRQSHRYDIAHKEVINVDVSELQPKYFLKFEVGDIMMMMIQSTKKRREEEEEEKEEVQCVATKTI
jgi:hypothetical protein